MIRFWPIQKGKQTLAHLFYQRFIGKISTSKWLNINGVKINVDLGDRMQAIFYMTGLYEPKTVALCLEHLPDRDGVYLDVGANVGLISLQVLAGKPETACHLFEADPNVFLRLKKNIEENQFKSVF